MKSLLKQFISLTSSTKIGRLTNDLIIENVMNRVISVNHQGIFCRFFQEKGGSLWVSFLQKQQKLYWEKHIFSCFRKRARCLIEKITASHQIKTNKMIFSIFFRKFPKLNLQFLMIIHKNTAFQQTFFRVIFQSPFKMMKKKTFKMTIKNIFFFKQVLAKF